MIYLLFHIILVYVKTILLILDFVCIIIYHIILNEISELYKFKNALKTFLFDHCFYNVDEFFFIFQELINVMASECW
jgi:hypothetical protein